MKYFTLCGLAILSLAPISNSNCNSPCGGGGTYGATDELGPPPRPNTLVFFNDGVQIHSQAVSDSSSEPVTFGEVMTIAPASGQTWGDVADTACENLAVDCL